MTQDLFVVLIPVSIFSLALTSWAILLLIKHENTYAKLTLVPAALALSIAVPFFFANLLGKAVPLPLPENFIYIAHQTIIQDNQKKKIEIWGATKTGTRLHVIPYNKKLEEQLKMAAKAKQGGSQILIERKRDRLTDSDESDIQIRIQDPEDVMPKSP